MSGLHILLVAIYFVLNISSENIVVDSRPPDYETSPFLEDANEETMTVTDYNENLQRHVVPILRKKFNRLPGVCRRLKRRRITILCNTDQLCSAMTYSHHGHICSCPKGSKCTHFFLRSL